MNFVAIDVEIANPDLASICQVGVSVFRGGEPSDQWVSLVNPQDCFDPINVSIHGIDESVVRASPTWDKVYHEVSSRITGTVTVSHTAFDRVAIHRVCEKYKLSDCECEWLDSAKVARRAWSKFSKSGYGLANLAAELGVEYRPHDALEDARCAGEILVRAMAESGLTLEQWLECVKRPIGGYGSQSITRDGNTDGPLHGEVLVFTGTLSMLRREAADLAAAAGCTVMAGVTSHMTLLVVGDQDVRRLAGHEKSSKQRKAEELIKEGLPIRILGETDFQKIVKLG